MDFLDRLWSILVKVESYTELCACLSKILQTIQREELRPFVSWSSSFSRSHRSRLPASYFCRKIRQIFAALSHFNVKLFNLTYFDNVFLIICLITDGKNLPNYLTKVQCSKPELVTFFEMCVFEEKRNIFTTGGLTNPRPWRGRCGASFSNTGGPPLPRKRAPFSKKESSCSKKFYDFFIFSPSRSMPTTSWSCPRSFSQLFAAPKCFRTCRRAESFPSKSSWNSEQRSSSVTTPMPSCVSLCQETAQGSVTKIWPGFLSPKSHLMLVLFLSFFSNFFCKVRAELEIKLRVTTKKPYSGLLWALPKC